MYGFGRKGLIILLQLYMSEYLRFHTFRSRHGGSKSPIFEWVMGDLLNWPKMAANLGTFTQNTTPPPKQLHCSSNFWQTIANSIVHNATCPFFDLFCCCGDIGSRVLLIFFSFFAPAAHHATRALAPSWHIQLLWGIVTNDLLNHSFTTLHVWIPKISYI